MLRRSSSQHFFLLARRTSPFTDGFDGDHSTMSGGYGSLQRTTISSFRVEYDSLAQFRVMNAMLLFCINASANTWMFLKINIPHPVILPEKAPWYGESRVFGQGENISGVRQEACTIFHRQEFYLETIMKLSSINFEKCRPFQTFNTKASSERDGAMLPMLAVTIVILFIACAFAVDIARMHLTRSEIRTATDAAARAAVESLGRVQDTGGATDAAIAIAQRNVVAGIGLSIDPNNVRFGSAVQGSNGKFTFEESNTVINSVRVVGQRDQNSPDGPVALMFGPLLGTDTFSPVATSTAVRLDRDIALVLDKSGSMSSDGRFDALQNGVEVFLTEMDRSIPEERVSLTVYDTFPKKLVDMTDQLTTIRDSIAQQTPGGFTGIGRALEFGIDSVQNDAGSRGAFSLKSVVLMTDGRQNRGISPVAVANRAKDLGIIVHTITFSSGANEALMKNVADKTGGIHVHADTDQELLDAFDTIANTIQVLTIQ